MSVKDFVEKTRVYLARYTGDKDSHQKSKRIVSYIAGPLPIFFIISNYFGFLNENDKHSWKGIIFFFLSFIYGLYCFWLYLENLWRS